MYGIKTAKGYLQSCQGYGKFWQWVACACYPFRSKEGAERIAKDWLTIPYEIVSNQY